MTVTAIETKGLTKTFRIRTAPVATATPTESAGSRWQDRVAVAGIDLTVEHGESLAFIGPNGAGKSTTIKMLTGILHPTAGEATVLGMVPWQQRERLAFRIGAVFGQKSQLWYHLPPLDTFNLFARIYELDQTAYRRRRDELIELFEIGDFLRVPVRKLSLGQRMRCEIAASLLHKPEIVFLDEPTIGLDVVAKQSIRDLIRRMNREEGTTVFLTSHDAGDIEQVCRRVVIINDGTVVLNDSVNTVKHEFLRNKVIDLRLDTTVNEYQFPGVRVLKAKGYGLKLEVDAAVTPIERVVADILSRFRVLGITIEDPSLETVIAQIYGQTTAKGRGA